MDASDKTLWVGNLPDTINEELLYELFLQAGPLDKVHLPKEKRHAFIQFKHVESVPYTVRIMDGISLFGRTLNMRARATSSSSSSSYDSPGAQMPRYNRNSQDRHSRRGENNDQNRGPIPYDNSSPKNYDDSYPNYNHYSRGHDNYQNSPGHGGNNNNNNNNPKNFLDSQSWQMGMAHQNLPNMQPSSGRRGQRWQDQSSRSSYSGEYKNNSSYRHEPYRRY